MTFPAFCTEQDVRDVLDANAAGTSRWSAGVISSNIQAASWHLERLTRREFANTTKTLQFTTNGEANVYIRGLRTASSVTLSGAALASDSSYYLIPDPQQTGVYTNIQFRPFGQRQDGPWYLGIPDWFERNLDSPKAAGGRLSSVPNDLQITGDWGYLPDDLPPPVRLAAKFLAAFYTLRPDALLSGARATETGLFDLSNFPIEVQAFVRDWRGGRMAATVGG